MSKTAIESIGAVILAETAPHVSNAMEWHIPPVIMETFQCIAWASAGVLAVVAVFKYLRKTK